MLVDEGTLQRLLPDSWVPTTLSLVAVAGAVLVVSGIRRTRFQFEDSASDRDESMLKWPILFMAPSATSLILWHHAKEVQIGWRSPLALAIAGCHWLSFLPGCGAVRGEPRRP